MISTQARRLWLTHWDSFTYAPVLSPRLDTFLRYKKSVRFCAVVRFLCASDLDSSVSFHPHLQLSDNFASSHRRSAYTALSLHSGSRIVFPKHGRRDRGAAAQIPSSKVSVLLTDPPIGSPSPTTGSLHPPLHPPLHLHLFTALVADVAYQVTTTGTVTTSSVSLVLAGSSSLWLDFDFATASKMITFLRFAARLLFLGHSSTPTSR